MAYFSTMKLLKYSFCILLFLFVSCTEKKQEVDLIVHHAAIYTVDSLFSVEQAMAVKNGVIVETGSNEVILKKYTAPDNVDANGKYIFPGFIDAHCHFYGYGRGLSQVNLVGTHSFHEVIEKTLAFYNQSFLDEIPKNKAQVVLDNYWLIGRGWDQNDWEIKEFPDKQKLDSLFPDIPVFLKRIDGHAAIVNQKVLDLVKFNNKTKIQGGELVIKNGKLSGVLIDNAVDSVEKLIPKPSKSFIEKALLNAEKNCLAMGITTVDDAGLDKNIVDAIDSLQQKGKLSIKVYAMLSPSQENFNYYLKNGVYKTNRLNVCSFKFYADGALGSRGACLCHEYSDKPGWKGFLLNNISFFERNAELMHKHGFQMNTHCIGDSAAKVILDIYAKYSRNNRKLRWRIEHAQVVTENSFTFFSNDILPSVQPTHATSDMYWAEKRLGAERIKNAYAYKKLLSYAGILPLGTDFPVEDISPFKTIYAAVSRKDEKGFPENGFMKENALSREEAVRGTTIWAAYANFEEKEKGSLESGKFADFVILDTDLMTCKESDILKTNVISTYINGKKVYTP